jgi:hypothetical protein
MTSFAAANELRAGGGGRLGPESPFWAVTSYFNPAGWRSRRRNYAVFRRHLALPLVTVELSGAWDAELSPDDADIYLRVRDGDLMWQKESLLNLGFAVLPAHVTHVAWIDCDVVLRRADWWRLALAALDESAVVQLFERVLHLAPSACEADLAAPDEALAALVVDRESAVAPVLAGVRREPGYLGRLPVRQRRIAGRPPVAKGVAWAARRDLVAALGLYDREIVGGGDSSALAAFGGDAERFEASVSASRRRCLGAPYLEWAARAFELVGGRLGAVPTDALHLWHGHLERRAYTERHAVLADHDFDLEHDLRTGLDGAWRWARDKPGLRAAIAAYFGSRCEDASGIATEGPPPRERGEALTIGADVG